MLFGIAHKQIISIAYQRCVVDWWQFREWNSKFLPQVQVVPQLQIFICQSCCLNLYKGRIGYGLILLQPIWLTLRARMFCLKLTIYLVPCQGCLEVIVRFMIRAKFWSPPPPHPPLPRGDFFFKIAWMVSVPGSQEGFHQKWSWSVQ